MEGTAEVTPAWTPEDIMPRPRIEQRERDPATVEALVGLGATTRQAEVLAGRGIDADTVATVGEIGEWASPTLAMLDHPASLADADTAAARIARALQQGEVIGLETDHDVDGVTAHAVLYRALTAHFGHPPEKVQSWIGHRLEEGYGLSEPLADRILAADPRPDLLITADNGSSDEARIARLAAAGIEVIVTDHHAFPVEGVPGSALACVSPARPDSEYPDPYIAGVMVAWLLTTRIRRYLLDHDPERDSGRPLSDLLDWVALGTVADCVSMGRSVNNRAVVTKGLALINGDHRPCWKALAEATGRGGAWTAADLAFSAGPRINARGRLDEAGTGVRFLLAEDPDELQELAGLLESENQARRGIEEQMLNKALAEAREQVAAGRNTLVVYLPEGHAGVHGIVASRLLERSGRPTICLSPKQGRPGVLAGSVRGIDGIHIRDTLQATEDTDPGLFLAFGGHAAAAGLSIQEASLDRLRDGFEAAAREVLEGRDLAPRIWTDGVLKESEIDRETVEALLELEPYGNGFEAPVMESTFEVLQAQTSRDGRHLRLRFRAGEVVLGGIWFSVFAAPSHAWMPEEGERVRVAFTLAEDNWNGRQGVQAIVRAMEPA